MQPRYYAITGVNVSSVFVPSSWTSPFSIGLGVTVSGTVTYSVQYTFDNTLADGFDPTVANWTNHPSLTAQTTAKDANIAYPVMGIRLNVTAGTGTATLAIIQAGE